MTMKKKAFQKLAGHMSLTQANRIKFEDLIENVQDLCGRNKASHSHLTAVEAAHETSKNH